MTDFYPKVSIVIPVYNGSNYLREAIDSALAQTYGNIEVIVVNDGSNDDGATDAIARSYGVKIRYFVKENGGVSSALNLAIHEMKGVYFSWLSHDDTYSPNKLEFQVKYIQNHSFPDIVGCCFEEINEAGEITSNYSTKTIIHVTNGSDVLNYWIYGCSLLISKTILQNAGLFNENNRTTQDLEMWMKIVHSSTAITLLPDMLCQRRHHREMGTYTLRPDVIHDIEVFFKELLSRYPLEFFSEHNSYLTRRNKAQIYDMLGEQARHRGAFNMAKEFYARALMVYPNPLDVICRSMVRKMISYYLHGISCPTFNDSSKL